MGISVTEDEGDKKIRGALETRKEITRRHARDTSAAEEIEARGDEVDICLVKNGDISKAYRLVNRTKDGEHIARRQGAGYEVTDPKGKARLVGGVVKDDAQVMGDLVLMETPVENYERRRSMRRKRAAQMYSDKMDEAKENINKIAREGGVVGRHTDAVIES